MPALPNGRRVQTTYLHEDMHEAPIRTGSWRCLRGPLEDLGSGGVAAGALCPVFVAYAAAAPAHYVIVILRCADPDVSYACSPRQGARVSTQATPHIHLHYIRR